MLTGNAADKTPQVSEIVVRAWVDYFRPFTSWTGDDLAVAVVEYCKRPRERLVQPADLGVIIKALRADELARMDPDERAREVGSRVRRDRHGYVDKSAPDEPDYPPDWTAEQRTGAYWTRIQGYREQREYEDAVARPGSLLNAPPASQATRAAAMAAFANRFAVDGDDDGEDGTPYVNMRLVGCPFCQADVREPCMKPGMPGQDREELTDIAAHPSRVAAAALAQGFSQEQADALVTRHTVRQAIRVRTVWLPGDVPPAPPEQRREVAAVPVDASVARGERIVAAGEYTPPDEPGPEPEGIPGGGYRDERGKLHFPDTDALDRDWSQLQGALFGEG